MTTPFLDLTASFIHVSGATPWGYFDSDPQFQVDSDAMVDFVYNKLGGRILEVELVNRDVYTSFEEAMLEYGATINSYQAKSILADIVGFATGSLSGHEQQLVQNSLAASTRRADAFGAEAGVGGKRTLFSSSIVMNTGQQNYDLKVLLSQSGEVTDGSQVEMREVFHFSPTAAYRFFDTASAINYLHNQFKFESFTPETVFYLLPVWEDVLRAQEMEMSFKVRRSHYSYHISNNVLRIYPIPSTVDILFFTYYKAATADPNGLFNQNDPTTSGVSNLSNVPFGNIPYNKINSMGKSWIRRFTLALCKEILGLNRSKFGPVPIPNGDLALNGEALINSAREDMNLLRDELRGLLEETTYQSLAIKQAESAEALERELAKVPMGIYMF